MNLYEIATKIQVGRKPETHYDVTPTFHVSAKNIERAAIMGQSKAYRWASSTYRWLFKMNPKGEYIQAVVTAVKLVDEGWL